MFEKTSLGVDWSWGRKDEEKEGKVEVSFVFLVFPALLSLQARQKVRTCFSRDGAGKFKLGRGKTKNKSVEGDGWDGS